MNQDIPMAHQDAILKPRNDQPHSTNTQSHNTTTHNQSHASFSPTTPDLPTPPLSHPVSTPSFAQTIPINPSTSGANVSFPVTSPIPLHDSHLPPPTQSKWRVTPTQKEALLKAFEEEPYPELAKKVQLADQLGVTTAQISKWFQHRRESLTRLGQFKAQYNRTRRTPEELDVLQTAFEEDRYPTAERLAQLEAQLTGVTAKQIKLWFKHRRKQVQKRNRTSNSPSMPSVPQPHLSLSANNNPNSLRIVRPDLAVSSHDPMRTDWRSPPNVGVIPAIPPSHPVPTPSVVQTAPQPPLPYSFDPHYYSYKGPPIMLAPQSPFSELELMALRGAQAVSSNAKPSQDGIVRLAHMLNRPHNILNDWFRSQDTIRQQDVVTDVSQQPFMQSPALTDQTMTRPYSTSHASPALQDYRKETDMQMTTVQDKSMNTASTSPKVQNGRDHDATRAFQQLEVKPPSDPSAGQKHLIGKNTVISTTVAPQVSPVALSTYIYSNGITGVEGNVVMPHQAAMFHANQGASAPMLAPLRYMPTNPPSQTYIPSNTVWYQQTQTFPK